jgi:hypothetical protein
MVGPPSDTGHRAREVGVAEPSHRDTSGIDAKSRNAVQDSPSIIGVNLLVGCLAGMLLVAGGFLLTLPPWTFSAWDGVLWGAAVLLAGSRALQVRLVRAATGTAPASWGRFAAILAGITAAIWVVGQSVQI